MGNVHGPRAEIKTVALTIAQLQDDWRRDEEQLPSGMPEVGALVESSRDRFMKLTIVRRGWTVNEYCQALQQLQGVLPDETLFYANTVSPVPLDELALASEWVVIERLINVEPWQGHDQVEEKYKELLPELAEKHGSPFRRLSHIEIDFATHNLPTPDSYVEFCFDSWISDDTGDVIYLPRGETPPDGYTEYEDPDYQ